MAPVSSKEPLDIRRTTGCTFTLKRGCHMIRRTRSWKFLAALHCFINLYQSEGISDYPWWNNSNRAYQELDQSDFCSSDQKNISCFSYLLGSKKSQEKPCLPDWFPINIPLVTEEILSPTTFVTEWTSIGYCKTSDFFWLIFPIRSSPSLATMRFPHSSSINKSLGESSKFPVSSLSMKSSSFSNITFFLKSGFFNWSVIFWK